MAKRLRLSKEAVQELNESRDRKATQLGQIYSSMGGSDSTLKPNYAQSNPAPTASIPVLERAVEDTYNALRSQSSPLTSANNGTSANARARLQNGGSAYQAYKNDITGKTLADIGQTDLAPISTGHFMGMGLGTGLTQEMKDAGLTREDLEAYNRQQNQQILRDVSNQIADEHPVLGSIGATVVNPFSAATNVTQNTANYLSGNPIENLINPATEIRQNVSEQIDNSRINDFLRGKVLKDKVNNVGSFAYNTANSILDMLTAMAIPGVSAPAVMGLEKGSDVINGAVDRGLTPDQIMAEGIGSGVTTALTEAIPFGKIAEGGNILGAMISEGLQEGSEDLADTLLDQIVTRAGGNVDKSELSTQLRNYLSAGYSQDDAVKAVRNDYIKTLLLDTLAGGISGGALGAGSNVMQGRNAFTGRIPTLETQTQNVNQTIPEVTQQMVDRMNEERAAQNTRNEDNARLNEALEKIEELRRQNEAANNDPELMNYLRDILSSTADESRNWKAAEPTTDEMLDYMRDILTSTSSESQNWENRQATIPTVNQNVEQNVRPNEQSIQTLNSPEQNARSIVDAFIQRGNFTREGLTSLRNELGMLVESNPMLQDTVGNMWNEVIDAVKNRSQQTTQRNTIPQAVHDYVSERTRLLNQLKDNQAYYSKAANAMELFKINDTIARLDAYMYDNYPQWVDEGGSFKWDEYNRLNSQAPQNTTENVGLSRREQTQYRRQTESLMSNLQMFPNTEALQNHLTTAYENLANNPTAESAQNYNRVVDEINNTMADETISTSMRDEKSDYYNAMKDLTDNKVIRVSRDMIKELGLNSVRELNNNVYTGKNSIVFRTSKGTPIDSAYMELYDLAHGSLPSPQSMAEGDLLNALYNYITSAKTDRDDTGREERWQDVPLLSMQTELDRRVEDLTDDIMTKIDDNTVTEKDLAEYLNSMIELQDKYPDKKKELYETFMKVNEAVNERVANADVHDPDIEDAESIEELNQIVEDELEDYDPDFESEEITMEIPREHNNTAGVRTGRYQDSRTYTNTGIEGGNVPEQIQELETKYGHMQYENNTEAESMEAAQKELDEKGIDEETRRLMNKDGWNNVDTDEFMMIYKDAVAYAEQLDAEGQDSEEAWGYAYDLFEKIKEEGSKHGQALQAYAKWSRSNTPEGLLAEAMSIIEEAKSENVGRVDYSKKTAWERQVAKQTENARRRENGREVAAVDINFMRNFLKEASKLNDVPVNSRAYKLIYDNLGKLVNTQIPAHLGERVRTLLMDNMLGNARTLITRNAGGNVGFNLVEELLRKPLSALIDKGLSAARGSKRTTTVTKDGYKSWLRGAADAFKQEAFDFKHGVHSARSGEVSLANSVGQNRNPMQMFSQYTEFENGKPKRQPAYNENDPKAVKAVKTGLRTIGDFFNKADNLVRYGLSVGDRWAYEASYAETMTNLYKLYNEGKLDHTFTTKDGQTITEKMSPKEFEKYAEKEAQVSALEACYQDDSEMAQAFLSARRFINKMSNALLGVDILSQFAMPFAKTPANIIQRAVEYSPLGIAKNAVQTIREVANPTTDFNQARFSKEASRNIIGSALFALGMLAAKSGGLTGGYSEDKDMRQAQKEAGMQEYALHNPFGLDADVDIGWLPVIGNDLVAAAAAYDAASQPELSPLQRVSKGFSEGLKTQFETSALQGLSRFVGGQGSFGNNDGDIVSNARDTLMSGMTQAIPSLMRQFANATDPYQRQLSGPNPDDYYFNSVQSAIPGLRQDLEPKIGRTGEELEQNHAQTTAGRWFNNFINPANVTYGTEDKVRDEAMRLFDSEGDNRAFEPAVTMNELKVDDHVPTAEEFTEYQRNAYGAMNEAAQQLINSDAYADMTDGQRINMLAQLYSSIKSVEKKNTLDLDKDDLTGPEKAYDEDGIDGLLDYLVGTDVLKQFGFDNNDKNREAVLSLLEDYDMSDIPDLVEDYQDRVNSATSTILSEMGSHSNLVPTATREDRAEMKDNIQSAIRSVEMRNLLGLDTSSLTGAAKAYSEGGVDGLRDYVLTSNVLDQLGIANNPTNRDKILEMIDSQGEDAVAQLVSDSQVLADLGSENLTFRYNHASQYIPTLTPQSFYDLFKAIDTDDPEKESIKQSELISYFNQNPNNYSSEDTMNYWLAFGPSKPWDKIPVLNVETGQWEAKKA